MLVLQRLGCSVLYGGKRLFTGVVGKHIAGCRRGPWYVEKIMSILLHSPFI
jgi:hypothetical protein